jgi:beta-glucosidase-like glycosyl hydrolase
MAWLLVLLLAAHAAAAAAAAAAGRAARVASCSGGAPQQWHLEGSSSSSSRTVRYSSGGLCLCAVRKSVADNPALGEHNATVAMLLPCSSPASNTTSCAWGTTSWGASLSNLTFVATTTPSAPGGHDPQCLTVSAHIWPVPAFRNDQLVLSSCSSATTWVATETGGAIKHSGGQCLDGGSGPAVPPPPPRACANASTKALGAKFCDATLSHAERAADLVSRLTVQELGPLLSMGLLNHETQFGTTFINQRLTGGVPRLGIGGFEFSEACHGILSGCLPASASSTGCPTSFPMPIGQAATFNESLWRQTATAISDEARALENGGINGVNFFAPNINVVRDPRWGRGYETAGEDALVNGRFAVQFVGGLQGSGQWLKAVATCKHSLLYDLETSRGSRSSTTTPRDMMEYFIVPFEFCLKRAGVSSIMCQYGADEGVPSCANGAINNELYRETFGGGDSFFMVSDCDAAGEATNHWANFSAANATVGVAKYMVGGLDVDCGSTYAAIPEAVQEGLLDEKVARQSALRFLTTQIALGALEPKSPYENIGAETVDSPEHRALALEGALQSLVLLRNEVVVKGGGNSGSSASSASGSRSQQQRALPLPSGAKIAFVGPHCESTDALLGNYHGINVQVLNSSILDVAAQRGLSFTYTNDPEEAGAMAAAADVAVLCLGLTVEDEGEGHDRKTLGLPQSQLDLVAAVTAVQPHTVAVLVNGGALSVEPLILHGGPAIAVSALIECFYPAQKGAEAIVMTLLGETNRFGKLPYTMYGAGFENRSIDNYDLQSDGGLTYRYYDGTTHGPVNFPAFHGLSYTDFTYEWASPPQATVGIASLLKPPLQQQQQQQLQQQQQQQQQQQPVTNGSCYDCSSLAYSVKVTNTGAVQGDAVVLGFVVPAANASTGLGRALFDFGRVELAAGASAVVTLRMDKACKQAITRVDEAGVRWVEAGDYTVTVGDIVAPATHALTATGASQRTDPSCR